MLTLSDTHECRQPVQQTVLNLSNDAAAAGLDTLPAILTLDACYFGLGLVLQSGQDASQLSSVLGMLQQHCGLACAEHAHLLRRRAAWLVGWILRTPLFTRLRSDDLAASNEPSPYAIMYTMLSELLADTHPGVRLAAALAVQGLFDATDTSPRADLAPRMPPSWKTESAEGGSGGNSSSCTDPLARLAASALLPVLHLSLHVHEIDSRWRMAQLLCRLLGRLASAQSLLLPQLPALAEWLPTAWAACGGEQLLQEATLDAGVTMLGACHEPSSPLLLAGLSLVAQATEDAAPPVGLVEVALRLWRSCVAGASHAHSELLGQRPGVDAQHLAPQLLALPSRLPALLDLGDELIRPAMLLLDWYVLADATDHLCSGQFVSSAIPPLVPTLKRAVAEPGPGTLAAISTLHTVLLADPSHAALLQPVFEATLTSLIAPEEDGAPNELTQAAMAGLLGRLMLTAPPVFAAAVQATSAALAMDGVHVQFGHCWVAVVDSVMLSSARKLACIALTSLIQHDVALLPIAPEVLSFCVAVLSDFDELPSAHLPTAKADGSPSAPSGPASLSTLGSTLSSTPLPMSGEHADFHRCLAQSSLDPIRALPLLPTLQANLQQASATHGEAFSVMMRSLDPALLAQVQHAFGGAS
uniref:Importin-7/11-like TPR repeats domain-containing protein n=1 Tax=Haptolina brevifila TaxID=156173 RepID=A0A7S2BDI7_9EUKA